MTITTACELSWRKATQWYLVPVIGEVNILQPEDS